MKAWGVWICQTRSLGGVAAAKPSFSQAKIDGWDTGEAVTTFDVLDPPEVQVNVSGGFFAWIRFKQDKTSVDIPMTASGNTWIGRLPVNHAGSAKFWFYAVDETGVENSTGPFDITLTDGKVFRYRCAAYDPYLGACDAEITAHHMIMVPDQVWPDSVPWNTTNTNQGTASEKHPYLASNLHRWEVNTFYPLLPAKWRNVIATHRALLEERYSASSTLTDSTGWSWADLGKVWSLSETEVYGEVVWGTKAWSKGYDCHFATFFALTRHRIRRNFSDARCSWWLRGAYGGSATHACNVYDVGDANGNVASSAGVRALPCFRVGV